MAGINQKSMGHWVFLKKRYVKKILMIEWASFYMQEQNRPPTIHWLFPSASPGAFWKPLSSREAPNSFSVDSN